MILFEQIWQVLYENGASAKKEEGTQRFWETLSSEEQEYAFTIISQKVKEGKFVQYDPIRAIKETIRRMKKATPEFLSFNDYYARYGTTEELDGWHQANPTGNKVIYVRQ